MMVAFLCCLSYITEIAGDAVAHAKDTGLLVQDIQNLVDVLALFVADELDNGRIHIAASGTPVSYTHLPARNDHAVRKRPG